MSLTYGSVCSGIEAATVAWHPLGMRAAWLSEIEPFPSAVLAYHYPQVPNLGDMRKIARAVLTGAAAAPDILVGGTPCQAFSIAGLREGLDDDRGQLTLTYVRLFDAIDFIRRRAGKQPAVAVWENVPGVLSSKDNAFGCFLAGLAGEDVPLEPPGKKWANAGCVFGPTRAVAWRVMDAQYAGLAQRRRRVFVVASARKGFDPSAVLFEFDGVRRDSAPSREAGKDVAGTLASRTGAGGGLGTDFVLDGGLQPVTGAPDIARCLTTSNQRIDAKTETLVPVAAYGFQQRIGRNGRGDMGDVCAALTSEAGTTGKGDSAPCVAIAFSCKDYGNDAAAEIAPTMRAMNHAASHANAGGQLAVAMVVHGTQDPCVGDDVAFALGRNNGGENAVCVTGDVTHTLKADGFDASEDGTGRGQPIVPTGPMAVRRLTPVECERLQGFLDGYTSIPSWNGWRAMDASETPDSCIAEGLEIKQNAKTGKWRVKDVDGPRYKALGNSMAVPCMRWIGARVLGYLNGELKKGFMT